MTLFIYYFCQIILHFKKLNKNEKALLNSRYLYGETQKEVALELKTNQVDISRQEKKVLMKLKTKLKS